MGCCSACLMLAPHSQLFVCLKDECPFSLQQQLPILSPAMFYQREKVFCGNCAFRGPHAPHRMFLRQAQGIAFSTASGEVGAKLEERFQKFMSIDKDSPTEHFMKDILKPQKVEKMNVVDYLMKSDSILEWHRRLSLLHDMLRTLDDFRTETNSFVRDQAAKLLTSYSIVSKQVQKDCTIGLPEKSDILRKRLHEHRQMMGELPSIDSDNYSYSSYSSSSSGRSVSTTTTVLQNTLHSRSSQVRRLQEMDLEVTGGFTFEKNEEESAAGKAIDEVVQTCVKLCRRFDAVCRFSDVNSAVYQIAEILDSETISDSKKGTVIKNLEEELSIKWPTVLPFLSVMRY
uniref:ENTH domain-containing protein n=1 Tax=Caenorhabditis tropicalis TaxID=1561998 RepID=A0A1I7UY78_9PELO